MNDSSQDGQIVAVNRVIDYMKTHLADDITLDDMAAVARFSRYHFTRIFSKHAGATPARYLMLLRIEETKRLLTTTDLMVSEIVKGVGGRTTLTDNFKKTIGVAPTAYRRQQQEQLARVGGGPDGS